MTQDDFIRWLRTEIRASELSQAAFARKHHISPQFMSQVLTGERPPSGILLRRFGFQRDVQIIPLKATA